MAELATIARPYAEALFKASQADLKGTAAWLDKLVLVTEDEQLLEFSGRPKSTADQVFGLIQDVVRTELPQTAQNFLRAVIDNNRLRAVPEMAAQFRAHVNAQSGASDALVYSAFEISVAALTEVTQSLEKRFGRKLNVVVEMQPELIGGIRVVVGDEVLDTSVKARLDQMKVALST